MSEPKTCIKCDVEQGTIRDFIKVQVIEVEDNQILCDQCLRAMLCRQQNEIKKIQERYIYQKEYQSATSESEIDTYLTTKSKFWQTQNDQQLRKLEQEEWEINETLRKLKRQCDELRQKVYVGEQQEEKFWESINRFEKRAYKLEEKSICAKNQKQVIKNNLEGREKTSVAHLFFKIKIQDSYSQVLGLTIGKKPDITEINWDETNTALTHVLFGFNYLITKYGLRYAKIKDMKIHGVLSEILLENSEAYLPVSYSKQNEKNFGIVLNTLLLELHDLYKHIQEIENIEYSENLKLPFPIHPIENKILDLYISPCALEQKNKWTLWTKAMRYFMIDFKHILTISSLSDQYL